MNSIKSLTNSTLQKEAKEAIPLITFDQSFKNFKINEEAITFIKKLEAPIGITCVAGKYRTGKSYLLNRVLLERSNGFSVGPTVNPCTKGLWIWPEAIEGKSADGKPMNILLVDSEGIGAAKESVDHDNRIFTLALLISSFFIFNSQGSIDEQAINNLSFIVEIASNIQKKNSDLESNDSSNISKFFPSFLWVLRDFTLRLEQGGSRVTSKEYLENALNIEEVQISDSRNTIRTQIREFFKERDCVTLVRPLINEDDLQNITNLSPSELRPEFLSGIKILREKVINNMKPKNMNGKALNGEMLCDLIKNYVGSINDGVVPVIQNVWTTVCKNECERARANCFFLYYKEMLNEHKHISYDEDELYANHRDAKKRALEKFKQMTNGGNVFKEYYDLLKDDINVKFFQIKTENSKKFEQICHKYIEDNYFDIKNKLMTSSYYSFSEYKSDLEKFMSKYLSQVPMGPCRGLTLYEFILAELKTNCENFLKYLMDKSKNSSEEYLKQIDDLKKLLNNSNSQLYENSNEKQLLNKTLENKEKEIQELSESLKNQIELIKKENEESKKILSNTLEQKIKQYEREVESLKNKNKGLENISEEEQSKLKRKETEIETMKSLHSDKVKNLELKIEELKKQKTEMKENLKCSGISMGGNSTLTEIQIKSLNDDKAKLIEKNKTLSETIDSLKREKIDFTNKIEKLQEENLELQEQIETKNKSLNLIGDEVRNREDFISKQIEENEVQIKNLKNKIDEKNDKINQLEDQISSQKIDFSKKIYELEDTIHKKELENFNLNEIIENQKSEFDSFIERKNQQFTNLEEKNKKLDDHIQSLHSNYKTKMDEQVTTYESKIDELETQIKDFEFKCAEIESKLLKKIEEEKKFISEIEEVKKQLEKTKQELEASFKSNEDAVKKHTLEVSQLRIRFDEEKSSYVNESTEEIKKINQDHEQKIKTLKEKFDEGVEVLTRHYNLDIDNLKSEMSKNNEEFKKRCEELRTEKEDELYNLNEEMNILKENNMSLSEEIRTLNREKETILLEHQKFVNDYNSTLNNIDENYKQNLEEETKKFKLYIHEKEMKLEEVNQLLVENNIKIGFLSSKNGLLEESILKLKDEIEKILNENNQVKESLNAKISSIQEEKMSFIMEHKDKISKLEIVISLREQMIEFKNNQIAELQAQANERNLENQDNLYKIKAELEEEYGQNLINLKEEKEKLDVELKEQVGLLNEKVNLFSKQKEQLEKEKFALIDKLANINELYKKLHNFIDNEKANFDKKLLDNKNEIRLEYEMKIKDFEVFRQKSKENDLLREKYIQEIEEINKKNKTDMNILEAELKKKENEIKFLKEMIEVEKTKPKHDNNYEIRENEPDNVRIEHLKKKNIENKKKIMELEYQIKVFENKKDCLNCNEKENEAQKSYLRELTKYQDRIGFYEKELSSQKSDYDKKINELTEIIKNTEQSKSYDNFNSSLKVKELTLAYSKINSEKKRIEANYDSEIKNLLKLIDTEKSKVQDTEAKLARALEENSNLRNEYKSMKNQKNSRSSSSSNYNLFTTHVKSNVKQNNITSSTNQGQENNNPNMDNLNSNYQSPLNTRVLSETKETRNNDDVLEQNNQIN